MSDTVEVGLLSGRTATVTAALDEEVGALKLRAQTALGMGDLFTCITATRRLLPSVRMDPS